jgi:hypothetical protein
MGKTNETFAGVILQGGDIYEFYPDATDCKHQGTPYLLLPNVRFQEIETNSTDVEHIDRLLHGTWRAKFNGDLSHVGCFKYRKTYRLAVYPLFIAVAN